MSPRKTNSKNPADWLLFAEAELEALQLLSEQQVAFLMCRSKCAEVLEKLMKAELILLSWPLAKTHDLQKLVDELDDRASPHVEELQPLAEDLAEYYFVGRYPGFDFEEDEDWAALGTQIQQIVAYGQRLRCAIANYAVQEDDG